MHERYPTTLHTPPQKAYYEGLQSFSRNYNPSFNRLSIPNGID
jgi:hypothetical protein